MILIALWACSTAEPPTPPPDATTPETTDPVKLFRTQIGLMARSDEDTCTGIRQAMALEAASSTDSELSATLLATPGFRRSKDRPIVDWRELSHAVNGGSAEVALITIGGARSTTQKPCLNLSSLSNWLTRSPAFAKLQECTKEAARDALKQVIQPLPDRACVCRPDPKALGRIVDSLDQAGIPSAAFMAWPSQPGWKACEVTGGPSQPR